MAAAWPSTLPPALLIKGYQRDGSGNTVWTETLSGRVNAQVVSTKTHRKVTGEMVMTTAQIATFETFYRTTLVQGSLPFQNINDPLTGANTVWRFVGEYTQSVYGQARGKWLVSMMLLSLPDAPV